MNNFTTAILAACLTSCSGRNPPSPEQVKEALFKDASLTSCTTWIGGCPWRDSASLSFYSSRVNHYLGNGGVAEDYSKAFVGVTNEGLVEILYWTKSWSGKYRLNYFYQAVGHVQACRDLSSAREHDLTQALAKKFDSSYTTSLGIFIDGESIPRAIPANLLWRKTFGRLSECDDEDK